MAVQRVRRHASLLATGTFGGRGSGAPFHRTPSEPQAMDKRVRSVAARPFRFKKLWRSVGPAPLQPKSEGAAARELFQFFADPREHPSDRIAVRETPPPNPSHQKIQSGQRLKVWRALPIGPDEARRNRTHRKCNGFAVPVTRVFSAPHAASCPPIHAPAWSATANYLLSCGRF